MEKETSNHAISFVFEQQDHQLVINAQTENVLYCAKVDSHALITFDKLKKALEIKNFTVVEQNQELMKLVIGGIAEVDFISKEKMIIDELKQSIETLTLKLQAEIQKNQQLCLLITNQQIQIQALNDKLSTQSELIQASLQQHQRQNEDKFQELSQAINALKEKLESDIDTFNQEHSERVTQLRQSLQYDKAKQEEKNVLNEQKNDEIKNQLHQFINQNRQNQLLQQSANQQTTQDITNLTAQLTQLRSQFGQLLNQTIPKCVTYKTKFFRDSEIVCKSHEQFTLMKFFTKTIKQVKLLYRASDDEFCVKKFHEKCDGIADTLTVFWTEFDRKIGGFTPLKWSSQNILTSDNSKESFMFSLTHNDKFTLQKPEHAIRNHPNYGPTIGGGHDLHVCDKANSENSSYTNICHSYHNEKYKYQDKASWERFHGGSTGSYNFKTKEWEVWAVDWA